MRSRIVRPGVFSDEHLGGLSDSHFKLFVGLWNLADREGKVEDRPRRIRAEVWPYESDETRDVNTLLADLERVGKINRYRAGERRVILIPEFKVDQPIHPREAPSRLPDPPEVLAHPHTPTKPRKGSADPLKAAQPPSLPPSLPLPLSLPLPPSLALMEGGRAEEVELTPAEFWTWTRDVRSQALPAAAEEQKPDAFDAWCARALEEVGESGLCGSFLNFLQDEGDFKLRGARMTVFMVDEVWRSRLPRPKKRRRY